MTTNTDINTNSDTDLIPIIGCIGFLYKGKPIHGLQNNQCQLLNYLIQNTGRACTVTEILEHAWGYNFDPGTNIVAVSVSRIRSALKPYELGHSLVTVPKCGYMWKSHT